MQRRRWFVLVPGTVNHGKKYNSYAMMDIKLRFQLSLPWFDECPKAQHFVIEQLVIINLGDERSAIIVGL